MNQIAMTKVSRPIQPLSAAVRAGSSTSRIAAQSRPHAIAQPATPLANSRHS
jgi:hypothetical protein